MKKINGWVKSAKILTNREWSINGRMIPWKDFVPKMKLYGDFISKQTIMSRIANGYSLLEAITTPINARRYNIEDKDRLNTWIKTAVIDGREWIINGEYMMRTEIQKKIDAESTVGSITMSGAATRLKYGMSLYDALTIPPKNSPRLKPKKESPVKEGQEPVLTRENVISMPWK